MNPTVSQTGVRSTRAGGSEALLTASNAPRDLQRGRCEEKPGIFLCELGRRSGSLDSFREARPSRPVAIMPSLSLILLPFVLILHGTKFEIPMEAHKRKAAALRIVQDF